MSEVLERTPLGTFAPKYGEAMTTVGVKVPKEIAEKLKNMPDKSQFLRDAIVKAVEEREHG